MTPSGPLVALADRRYDGEVLLDALGELLPGLRLVRAKRAGVVLACEELRNLLDAQPGDTLQQRWGAFEWRVWPEWLCGRGRPPHNRWALGVCALVISQAARPSWPFLECTRTRAWIKKATARRAVGRRV